MKNFLIYKNLISRLREYIFIFLTATIFSIIIISKSFSNENIFIVDNIKVQGPIDLNFSRDKYINEAFIKSLIAAGYVMPRKNGSVLVSVGGTDKKIETLPIIKKFNSLGFKIFATEHTADYLAKNDINSIALYKIGEKDRKPNLEDYLVKRELDLIINIPSKSTDNKMKDIIEDEYLIRRKAVEMGIPVFTTIEASKVFVDGLEWLENNGINIVEKINNK